MTRKDRRPVVILAALVLSWMGAVIGCEPANAQRVQPMPEYAANGATLPAHYAQPTATLVNVTVDGVAADPPAITTEGEVDGTLTPGKIYYSECSVKKTEGGKARYDWSASKGVDFGKDGAGHGDTIMWTAIAGNVELSCIVSRTASDCDLLPAASVLKKLKIGEPPPPPPVKTLAQLAGDKAPAIVGECRALLAAVPALKTNAKLVEALTDQFAALDLTGDPATAAAQIVARITSDDASFDVVAELGKIVVELNGDPNPPKPPGPLTPLAALVPDPAHRALIAEFYADMAAVVRAGGAATVADFYAAQRRAVAAAQANGKLPKGIAAINKPISDRILAALGGTDNVPLDAAKRTALAAALDGVAAEFRGA